jgi:hypothetical protein
MKQWLRDGLIGWAAGCLTFLVVAFFSNVFGSVLTGHYSNGLFPIFSAIIVVTLIPGFLEGFLGGKYLKFYSGNAVGGGILSIVVGIISQM